MYGRKFGPQTILALFRIAVMIRRLQYRAGTKGEWSLFGGGMEVIMTRRNDDLTVLPHSVNIFMSIVVIDLNSNTIKRQRNIPFLS